MTTYYSPTGNPEIWREKPDGYYTPEEWFAANPQPTAPEPSVEELKAAKREEIAAARYASATGTVTINGYLYSIDKDSQTSFLGTLAALQNGAMTSTIWKTAGGRFVTLNAAEFLQVVTIVLAYISACFGAESSILEQVEAASSAEELAAVVWVAPDVKVVMAGLE